MCVYGRENAAALALLIFLYMFAYTCRHNTLLLFLLTHEKNNTDWSERCVALAR